MEGKEERIITFEENRQIELDRYFGGFVNRIKPENYRYQRGDIGELFSKIREHEFWRMAFAYDAEDVEDMLFYYHCDECKKVRSKVISIGEDDIEFGRSYICEECLVKKLNKIRNDEYIEVYPVHYRHREKVIGRLELRQKEIIKLFERGHFVVAPSITVYRNTETHEIVDIDINEVSLIPRKDIDTESEDIE